MGVKQKMSLLQLLTEKELAERLNVSAQKLRQDRSCKKGLPYIKIGGSVRYAPEQVQKYLAEHTIGASA